MGALERLRKFAGLVLPGQKPAPLKDLYTYITADYRINEHKTSRNVEGAWKAHLEKYFGDHPAREYDPELVQRYIQDRKKVGAKNATINRELAVLKRMASLGLQYLKTDDDKLIAALVRWSKIKGLKERNVRKGYLKDSEYEALARESATIGLWMRAMFEAGYTYGWRRSELLDLRVAQVDISSRLIDLNPGETKNDQSRTVEMPPVLLKLMEQCIFGKRATDYVFTREPEKIRPNKLRPVRNFAKDWTKVTERAGVPGLLFHDLRRTAARNLRRQGIPEKTIMVIMGHKTRSMFDRYNIIDAEDLKQAAKKMSEAAREREAQARYEQHSLFEDSQGSAISNPQAESSASKKPN